MEIMDTVANSDGDFFTLVQVGEVHTLVVYENRTQTVMSTMMRYIPKTEIWVEVVRHASGKIEINEFHRSIGYRITDEWKNLQKYADEFVDM